MRTSSHKSFTTKFGVRGRYLFLHHQISLFTERLSSNAAQKLVVLKCASDVRLQREREILQQFAGNAHIRQLVDWSKEPTLLVLEHLETDALRYSSEAKISRQNIKLIARSILSALESLHAKSIAHTGRMIHFHPAEMTGLIICAARHQTGQHPSQLRRRSQ